MDLIQFLTSINQTKENLFETGNPEALEKAYPRFIINKMLSYHADAILLVNELNLRNGPNYGISNRQHYEFLLRVLDKKKRYTKLSKPDVDEKVDLLVRVLKYSKDRALEVVDLYSEDQYERLRNAYGGKT